MSTRAETDETPVGLLNAFCRHIVSLSWLDAKREQVYAAAFELRNGTYEKVIDAHLAEPGHFLARCPKPLAVFGEGIPYHQEAIDASRVTVLDRDLWPPRAEHVYQVGIQMASAGQYTPGGELLPLYIRRPEAEEKWEQLHGTGSTTG